MIAYKAEPPIEWNKFLETKSFEITSKSEGHVICHLDGTFMHAYNVDGNTELHRYGINRVYDKFLPIIIKEFNCKIFDDYGCEYPDCGN
jgi:hypothetical protein